MLRRGGGQCGNIFSMTDLLPKYFLGVSGVTVLEVQSPVESSEVFLQSINCVFPQQVSIVTRPSHTTAELC